MTGRDSQNAYPLKALPNRGTRPGARRATPQRGVGQARPRAVGGGRGKAPVALPQSPGVKVLLTNAGFLKPGADRLMKVSLRSSPGLKRLGSPRNDRQPVPAHRRCSNLVTSRPCRGDRRRLVGAELSDAGAAAVSESVEELRRRLTETRFAPGALRRSLDFARDALAERVRLVRVRAVLRLEGCRVRFLLAAAGPRGVDRRLLLLGFGRVGLL